MAFRSAHVLTEGDVSSLEEEVVLLEKTIDSSNYEADLSVEVSRLEEIISTIQSSKKSMRLNNKVIRLF